MGIGQNQQKENRPREGTRKRPAYSNTQGTSLEVMIDQHLAEPSSEKLPPTASGNKAKIHRQLICKERVTLRHSALNRVSPSNFCLQALGNPAEEKAECGRQRRWRPLRRQGPLNEHDHSSYELLETEAVCTESA